MKELSPGICSHNLLLKLDSKSTKISSKVLKCNPKITKVRSWKVQKCRPNSLSKGAAKRTTIVWQTSNFACQAPVFVSLAATKTCTWPTVFACGKQTIVFEHWQTKPACQAVFVVETKRPAKRTSILGKKNFKCLPNTFDRGLKWRLHLRFSILVLATRHFLKAVLRLKSKVVTDVASCLWYLNVLQKV